MNSGGRLGDAPCRNSVPLASTSTTLQGAVASQPFDDKAQFFERLGQRAAGGYHFQQLLLTGQQGVTALQRCIILGAFDHDARDVRALIDDALVQIGLLAGRIEIDGKSADNIAGS